MNPGGFIHTASGANPAGAIATGQNANVTIQKLNFPDLAQSDAFVVTDLDNASRATGVVRSAKKILQDGAKLMARSQTYAWAVLGQQISGASAGINTQGDERQEAIAGFCKQVLPRVSAGELSLGPAKGVTAPELSDLFDADEKWSKLRQESDGTTLATSLLVTGVVAATTTVIGGLDGRTVAIVGEGDWSDLLVSSLRRGGADVTAGNDPDIFSTQADALICGSKSGLVDHNIALTLAQKAIIPIVPTPVTARGLAVARRRGIRVLADFVTTAGPLLVEEDPPSDPDSLITAVRERISANCLDFAEHPDGDLLAACYRAEEFLVTWREELPFGRPIA